MKVPVRTSSNRNTQHEQQQSDYANFSHTKIITLFQVPQYEHLQILICSGNSLTTLAGIEHVKHLWKLDVGNNQIRSLQHLSRFIALGSLILSNNYITWMELQHIRHMCILDLKLDGNPGLDSDPNYRQHVLDCLSRVWMCDGVFVSTAERNQIDEFFTQSSFTQKPVRHKLSRDVFMPSNLKDRSINGLFGTKATELFAKFPMNCFVNSELDRKRIKHLANTMQDLIMTEMKYDDQLKQNELFKENQHLLSHMIDLRQANIEKFNMLLILLLSDITFQIPDQLLINALDLTQIKTIGNFNIHDIFSSNEKLKCIIASLVHAGARIDRDENHPSAFYDKLFTSLSIVLTNQARQLSLSPSMNQTQQNTGLVSEAKTLVCLEVMQVFIMCPLFYTLVEDSSVNAILKQALERSPAYKSIKDVLANFNADQKTGEEQKELLGPIIGNILKMAIRTLSSKRVKKSIEPVPTVHEASMNETENLNKKPHEQSMVSPRMSQHGTTSRVPAIGDRVLTAPQTIGRIVTLPDAEIAMIQLDSILAVNGSMINTGSSIDHTHYVNLNNFEWDSAHDYWKPMFTFGDKITLQMTSIRCETPRSVITTPTSPPPLIQVPALPPAPPPRTIRSKTPESTERGRITPKLFELNINRPKEAFVDTPREITPCSSTVNNHQETVRSNQDIRKLPPPVPIIHEEKILHTRTIPMVLPSSPRLPDNRTVISDEAPMERPMSVRIIRQKQEHIKTSENGDTFISPPVLIESMLLLMPNEQQMPIVTYEQTQPPSNSTTTTMNDFEPLRAVSIVEPSSTVAPTSAVSQATATQRVPVPIHNASLWFSGPDLQNHRTGRMEKVVASLVRRSFRPLPTYAMPRVPVLTSPSSKDHAYYRGVRPESYQDFRVESHRMVTNSISIPRQNQSPVKTRYTPSMRLHDSSRITSANNQVHRTKSLITPPCSTPWM